MMLPFFKIGLKSESAQQVNPKKRKEKPKERHPKILKNTWTTDFDEAKDNSTNEGQNLDELDAQEAPKEDDKYISPDELDGLRQIKFQCEHCMMVFSQEQIL